jgi:hypothetical protein
MTAGLPDPDILIRPSGEQRISNFLLWQSAYTEFFFTPTLWPDFGRADLEQALRDYASGSAVMAQLYKDRTDHDLTRPWSSSCFQLCSCTACYRHPLFGSWPFWILLLIAFAIAVYEWLNVASRTNFELPASIFGIVYIAFSMVCFALLREQGQWIALVLLAAVWLSDTGAYIAGKLIGGPKMAPTISPNKTWAGMGGAILAQPWRSVSWPVIRCLKGSVLQGVMYGAIVAVSGQMGDLLVSMLKRRAGGQGYESPYTRARRTDGPD